MICETQLVTSDGLSLYSWIRHLPDQPKGVIALVHGMGEHSRRYLIQTFILWMNMDM